MSHPSFLLCHVSVCLDPTRVGINTHNSTEEVIMVGVARMVEKEWVSHPSGNRVTVKLRPIPMQDNVTEMHFVLHPKDVLQLRMNALTV